MKHDDQDLDADATPWTSEQSGDRSYITWHTPVSVDGYTPRRVTADGIGVGVGAGERERVGVREEDGEGEGEGDSVALGAMHDACSSELMSDVTSAV